MHSPEGASVLSDRQNGHKTHRSENRVGNVEKFAFGTCAVALRWSVTTALVRLRRIFPLDQGSCHAASTVFAALPFVPYNLDRTNEY